MVVLLVHVWGEIQRRPMDSPAQVPETQCYHAMVSSLFDVISEMNEDNGFL